MSKNPVCSPWICLRVKFLWTVDFYGVNEYRGKYTIVPWILWGPMKSFSSLAQTVGFVFLGDFSFCTMGFITIKAYHLGHFFGTFFQASNMQTLVSICLRLYNSTQFYRDSNNRLQGSPLSNQYNEHCSHEIHHFGVYSRIFEMMGSCMCQPHHPSLWHLADAIGDLCLWRFKCGYFYLSLGAKMDCVDRIRWEDIQTRWCFFKRSFFQLGEG